MGQTGPTMSTSSSRRISRERSAPRQKPNFCRAFLRTAGGVISCCVCRCFCSYHYARLRSCRTLTKGLPTMSGANSRAGSSQDKYNSRLAAANNIRLRPCAIACLAASSGRRRSTCANVDPLLNPPSRRRTNQNIYYTSSTTRTS